MRPTASSKVPSSPPPALGDRGVVPARRDAGRRRGDAAAIGPATRRASRAATAQPNRSAPAVPARIERTAAAAAARASSLLPKGVVGDQARPAPPNCSLAVAASEARRTQSGEGWRKAERAASIQATVAASALAAACRTASEAARVGHGSGDCRRSSLGQAGDALLLRLPRRGGRRASGGAGGPRRSPRRRLPRRGPGRWRPGLGEKARRRPSPARPTLCSARRPSPAVTAAISVKAKMMRSLSERPVPFVRGAFQPRRISVPCRCMPSPAP